MVLLFRDFYEKQYKVPMCSCVACIWFIFFVLTLAVPLFLAHSAGGKSSILYWLKHCNRPLGKGENVLWRAGGQVQWRHNLGGHGRFWPLSSLLFSPWDQLNAELLARRSPHNLDAKVSQRRLRKDAAAQTQHRDARSWTLKSAQYPGVLQLPVSVDWEAQHWHGWYDAHRSWHPQRSSQGQSEWRTQVWAVWSNPSWLNHAHTLPRVSHHTRLLRKHRPPRYPWELRGSHREAQIRLPMAHSASGIPIQDSGGHWRLRPSLTRVKLHSRSLGNPQERLDSVPIHFDSFAGAILGLCRLPAETPAARDLDRERPDSQKEEVNNQY